MLVKVLLNFKEKKRNEWSSFYLYQDNVIQIGVFKSITCFIRHISDKTVPAYTVFIYMCRIADTTFYHCGVVSTLFQL